MKNYKERPIVFYFSEGCKLEYESNVLVGKGKFERTCRALYNLNLFPFPSSENLFTKYFVALIGFMAFKHLDLMFNKFSWFENFATCQKI